MQAEVITNEIDLRYDEVNDTWEFLRFTDYKTSQTFTSKRMAIRAYLQGKLKWS